MQSASRVLVRAASRTPAAAASHASARVLARALATRPQEPLSGVASVQPPIVPSVPSSSAAGTTTASTINATSGGASSSVSSTAAAAPPPVPPPTPPPSGGQSRWRRFLQTVGRVTLVSILAAGGTVYYVAQKDRTPGPQLPLDPAKKTIVVLGTGWGATSLLKNLDNEEYNVIVVSPKNFFLFTPLLPSVAVGTLNPRSIIQPIRTITRHKKRQVSVIEAEAQAIDPAAKTVTFADTSGVQGAAWSTTLPYDYLVVAVGAETQTFNIPGVKEHACFMKELQDAEKMQDRFIDCVETAAFPGQADAEVDRLLHAVVVGGGPTGIELSGELHDFLEEDLRAWYPELAGRVRISLIEALPSVLPMFSKRLIDYTLSTFKEAKIDVLTKTMVQEVKPKSIVVKRPDGTVDEIPCGIVVWAGGNKQRKVTTDLMGAFPADQTNKRGITVDDHMRMKGARDIFAIGDCTASSYAPTAQVATQEGAYLARVFVQLARADKIRARVAELRAEGKTLHEVDQAQRQLEKAERTRPFHYSHQGSLAYIGSDRAISDLSVWQRTVSTGGTWTYLFWRSAYLSSLFSLRNRTLVAADWLKVKVFGRDVSRE